LTGKRESERCLGAYQIREKTPTGSARNLIKKRKVAKGPDIKADREQVKRGGPWESNKGVGSGAKRGEGGGREFKRRRVMHSGRKT